MFHIYSAKVVMPNTLKLITLSISLQGNVLLGQTRTTHSITAADQVHLLMAMALHNGCSPPVGQCAWKQHKNCSGMTTEI